MRMTPKEEQDLYHHSYYHTRCRVNERKKFWLFGRKRYTLSFQHVTITSDEKFTDYQVWILIKFVLGDPEHKTSVPPLLRDIV